MHQALTRLEANPLLTPDDLAPTREGLEVLCTLNPAAVRFGEETLLLVRIGERVPLEKDYVACLWFDAAEGELKVRRIRKDDPALDCTDPRGFVYRGRMLLTSLSHLRLARSRDGVNFTFDPAPAIFPATPYEAFGCEDARITAIDDRYLITYTAVSDLGVCVAMAWTRDFVSFQRDGLIFPPYQKDVVIFPRKIDGMYVCRHRPAASEFNEASIWTAWSPNLVCWGGHEMTLAPRPDMWDSERVGAGAPPLATDEGWLELYHACDDAGRYCLGAMLSDLEHPHRVLCRSLRPVLEPAMLYEQTGVYDNCVFHNGLIADDDGTLRVYYGAADRVCAAAVTTVRDMIAAAKRRK